MKTFKQFLDEELKIDKPRSRAAGRASLTRFASIERQAPQYDLDDKAALHHYSVHGSKRLAMVHLGQNPAVKPSFGDTNFDHNLSKAITKYRLPRKMIVYHGASFDPSKFGKNDEGNHDLHNPTYLSTTVNFNVASRFAHEKYLRSDNNDAKHILRIHLPQDTHTGVIGSEGERELLLHKGHRLHIDPNPKHVEHWDYGKFKVWNAHLVHDGVHK